MWSRASFRLKHVVAPVAVAATPMRRRSFKADFDMSTM
jgi:hypothetical protein